jgi:4-amino-4-deoxy-L-arabinose transferase-like glycosyltransferase
MLVTETHQGKTDAMLLATIVAAQGALWQLYAGEKKWCYFLTLWIAAGMGTMIKGPVAPMIVALTTLSLMAWDRRIDLFIAMKPWFGIPLFLLIVSPWFYAISQETGSNFIADSFMEDILPKLVGAQESHGAPPSYYAMLVWVMFWPAVFFLLPALYHGWKYKTNSNIRFLLAWLIPTWLFFELVPTKLPHYVLPTYPALALLIAWYLYQHFERSTLQKINAIIGSIIAVALAGGFIALPIITEKTFHPFSLIAVGGIVLVLFAVWRHTLPTSKRLIFATLGVVITFGSVFQFIFPSLDHIWISKRIQQATHTYIAEETQIISVGYSEPSLVFLMGTGIMLTSAEDAAARIKQRSAPTLLLLEERHAQAFHEGYSDLPKPVGKVEGLNYSKAKPVSIAIYKVGHATE